MSTLVDITSLDSYIFEQIPRLGQSTTFLNVFTDHAAAVAWQPLWGQLWGSA